MSLEASVTAALTAVNNSINTLNGVGAAFQAGAANLTAGYQAVVASAVRSAVVDQVAGSDATGDGSGAAPYKTIQKALDMTPRGGVCQVTLRSDYSHLTDDTLIDGRRMILNVEGVAKKNIYFAKTSVVSGAYTLRKLYGFKFKNGGSIAAYSVILNVPAAVGAESGWLAHDNGAVFKTDDSQGDGGFSIMLLGCDISVPNANFGALVGSITPVPCAFNWQNNAMIGEATSILGRLFAGQTNTAGTASTTLPWLLTNLANV